MTQEPRETGRPLAPPLHWSAIYEFDDADRLAHAVQNPDDAYSYGRYDNPTVVAFEREVAALEGADSAVAFASGLAAIATSVLALVPADGRIVQQREIYGGTSVLFRDWGPRFAGEVVEVSAREPEALLAAITPGTDLVFLESPVNPTLDLVDLRAVARAARTAGARTMVDNTFATPLGQRPLDHGIDASVHSATKFLGGHHDAIAGVVAVRSDLVDPIRRARRILGPVLSPADAYLLQRGLRTLGVRHDTGAAHALELARRAQADARAARVIHPGLPEHPSHALAREQMLSSGALLALEVGPDRAAAARFLDALQVVRRVATLGGTESTAMIPVDTSHAGMTPEARAAAGVPDGLVRLSIGVEPLEALWEDVRRGLDAATG